MTTKLLSWFTNFFDDTYWTENATPDDVKQFEAYAEQFNLQYLRAMMLLMGLSTLLWWPLDRVIFRKSAHSLGAFAGWRIGFMMVAFGAYVVLTYNAWFRQRLFLVSLCIIIPGGVVLGFFVPMIELGGAWPYGGLPLPLLTALFLTSLPRRVLLTFLLATAYPVTYYLTHPKGLQYEMMLFFGGLFLFPVFLSIVAGHKIMQMMRQQRLYQDRMEKATAKLASFNKALVSRVNHQTEALQEIAQQVEQVREGERASLAQELHDHLGQVLTGMRFELDLVQMQVNEMEDADHLNLQGMDRMLTDVTETVRDVMTMLRPKIVSQSGLFAAAQWLVQTMKERKSFAIELHLPEQEPDLNEDAAIALFRIVQESLTNTLKHAEASEVNVQIERQDKQLRLTVKDNGVGCQTHVAEHSIGLGLSGMKERAQSIGGTFSFASTPGQGTTIQVTVPLQRPNQTTAAPEKE
jgi:signal transduction histidine kinase